MQAVLPPAFLSEKSGTKELDFVFYEFVRLNLCRTNGYGFAEDKICYFCLLVRENCRRSYRLCAVEFMPHKRARGVYPFFPRRKKGSKKYAEGVRTLSTPMERRKTSAPLCFAGFTAILEISNFHQTQKTYFLFFP